PVTFFVVWVFFLFWGGPCMISDAGALHELTASGDMTKSPLHTPQNGHPGSSSAAFPPPPYLSSSSLPPFLFLLLSLPFLFSFASLFPTCTCAYVLMVLYAPLWLSAYFVYILSTPPPGRPPLIMWQGLNRTLTMHMPRSNILHDRHIPADTLQHVNTLLAKAY